MGTNYNSFVLFILFKSIKETSVWNQNKKQNLSELQKLTAMERRIGIEWWNTNLMVSQTSIESKQGTR